MIKKNFSYINGNTSVFIDKITGTRIMETEDDDFNLDFPVSIDLMISEKCNFNCPFCYANCSPDGKEADFRKWNFLKNLHEGTEIAININSDIPSWLTTFLTEMKNKNIIVNATVRMETLENHIDYFSKIYELDLIHGIGISLPDEYSDARIKKLISAFPTLVIHAIVGIFDESDWMILEDLDVKILFLGYKFKGRGRDYYFDGFSIIAEEWLRNHLKEIKNKTRVLAFDCLAIEQLNVKKLVSKEEWERIYQGEDGTISMAINLVRGTFSKSSTDSKEFPILSNIEDMFKIVKSL